MRIGPYLLENNLVVAPMAGVTDLPFRRLCRRFGAGLAVSEMISSDSSLWGTPKSTKRLDFTGEPDPVTVQIMGADPRVMAEAARANVSRGARIIDINMGCPAKKVCKVSAGSALMRDPERVRRILHAVVDAVPVPVTLKIRTGWDQSHRNAAEIALIAQEAGIGAIAIHGRTRNCGFSGEAEYETIRQVKEVLEIPVIANGDIDSPHKARMVLDETGADGLMIGRAAQGRPWIFREIAHHLSTGELLDPPSTEWIRDVLCEHLETLYRFYGEQRGVLVARKHIAWYSRSQPGGSWFRRMLNAAASAREQQALIGRFFDQLANNKEWAA